MIGLKNLVTCALSHVFELFGGFMPTNGFCNKISKKLKIQTAQTQPRGVLKPRPKKLIVKIHLVDIRKRSPQFSKHI